MYKDVIGVVGGMGSYATLNFFRMLLEAFPAKKEWDRPRILIDNRCTMPSRVLAVLNGDKYDLLVEELSDSVDGLIKLGATKIILACNTSHCFLEDIYKHVPSSEKYIINIIEQCCKRIESKGISSVGIIATEGTIQSGIYQKYLERMGISVVYPSDDAFYHQRYLIEKVKQNIVEDEDVNLFVQLIESFTCDVIILGCTEFPVLYQLASDRINPRITVIDPLREAIDLLREGCE